MNERLNKALLELAEMQPHFVLSEIKLVSVNATLLRPVSDVLDRSVNLTQGHDVKVGIHPQNFEVKATYRMDIIPMENENDANAGLNDPRAAVRFMITHAVEYAVNPVVPADKLRPELIELFAETSTILHLWPYWRQLSNDLINRMNYPQLLLPPMTFQKLLMEINKKWEVPEVTGT